MMKRPSGVYFRAAPRPTDSMLRKLESYFRFPLGDDITKIADASAPVILLTPSLTRLTNIGLCGQS